MDLGRAECFIGAMNEAGIFLLFGLFAVVAVFFGWLSWKQERERTDALGALAQRLKWTFSGQAKDGDFDGRYGQFGCFQRGHSRYAHNQMRGTIEALGREVEAQAGDFHYKITRNTGKSSSTTTYRFSYFLVKLPFGFEDIDFESAEFSRLYHVSGSDRKFVYAVLHPRMIDWMLNAPPPAFELSRGVLLVTSGGERWDTDEFEGAFGWMEAFLSRWPDYLVKDIEAR
jgi:hypothetical protein